MKKQVFVYVCGWAIKNGTPGIGLFRFDGEKGQLEFVKRVNEDASVGFTYIDKVNNIFYCSHETPNLDGLRAGGGGSIYSFKIDPETGDMQLLSKAMSYASNASYLTLDKTGKYLVVANHGDAGPITKSVKDAFGNYQLLVEYDDSTVAMFAINEDGSVGKPLDIVKHFGNGPERKQAFAHPHTALLSPSGNLIAVCDKGTDSIYMYKIDYEKKKLVCASVPIKTEPASRTRHCVFHPTRPYLYVNHEGRLAVSAFKYDENGNMEFIGDCDVIEPGMDNNGKACQGICIHPSGDYVYNVVHGSTCISVHKVDEATGKLMLIQAFNVGGEWPRGIAISPDGEYILSSDFQRGRVKVLKVNSDGTLTDTGNDATFPSSAIMTFYQPM